MPDILECGVEWTLGSRHSVAHSFTELHEAVVHGIILVSFL